jgi:hypothetical protein
MLCFTAFPWTCFRTCVLTKSTSSRRNATWDKPHHKNCRF